MLTSRNIKKNLKKSEKIRKDLEKSEKIRKNQKNILVSIAAHHSWDIVHADVPNAYLNGACPKLILIQLPKMWVRTVGDGIGQDGDPVIMANSLYGSPDAGRNWN